MIPIWFVMTIMEGGAITRTEVFDRLGDPETSVAKVGYRLTALVAAGKAVKSEVVADGTDGKSHKYAAYSLA